MQNSDIASLALATVGIFLIIRNYGGESLRLSVRFLRVQAWDLWGYDNQNDTEACAGNAKNHQPRAIYSAIFKGFTSVLKIWPVLVVFIILTQWILPEYPQQDKVRELKDVGGPLFYEMFLYAGLVFPVLEELIFRGLLYPILKKHIGVFWGCVTSSLLFSLIHDNVLSFALLFLFSVYLTILYERNNNLLIPIASHAFFNVIMLTLILIDGL